MSAMYRILDGWDGYLTAHLHKLLVGGGWYGTSVISSAGEATPLQGV